MASQIFFVIAGLLALACSHAVIAYDPSPLQDFCVADTASRVFVNGFTCRDPRLVQGNDFFFAGLDRQGNTANRLGLAVTAVFVEQLPGLNTLGISLARIDFAPNGVNPPHTHPRASEILTVLEGTLIVGFITSNPENRLIFRALRKGDVFVFPIGLIHFQFNTGTGNAVALAALSSQNPGVVIVPNTVFGARPSINDAFLAKAFQMDTNAVDRLQALFATNLSQLTIM